MANDKVRIGVIGAGAIGPSHAFAVDQVDTCELTAVCDVVPEAAERLAKENDVAAFSSVGDMLEAQAFAYLAVRSRRGLPLTFPTTTGAPRPMTGGQLDTAIL